MIVLSKCQDKNTEDKLVADGKSLLYVFECEVNVCLYNLYLFIFIFSKSNLKVSDNENLQSGRMHEI